METVGESQVRGLLIVVEQTGLCRWGRRRRENFRGEVDDWEPPEEWTRWGAGTIGAETISFVLLGPPAGARAIDCPPQLYADRLLGLDTDGRIQ